jgi:hypothetical protein
VLVREEAEVEVAVVLKLARCLRAVAVGRGFHLSQDTVQRGAIEQAAVGDYRGDLLRVVNVVLRICAEQDQVRDFSRLYRAIAAFHS